MAMTVNPVVDSAPDTLHIEGLYAFRLTGDAREDVVFKFRFNDKVNLCNRDHVVEMMKQRQCAESLRRGDNRGEQEER